MEGEPKESEGVEGEGVSGEGAEGEGVSGEDAEGAGVGGEGVSGEGVGGEGVAVEKAEVSGSERQPPEERSEVSCDEAAQSMHISQLSHLIGGSGHTH